MANKQRIQFDSPLDALLALAKRLTGYESQTGMESEEFFARFNRGELGDDALFIDWANDYRHYLALRDEIEHRLHEAA